jgi:hypothetical protein
MVLKFSAVPVLNYGNESARKSVVPDNWQTRFPPGAVPIATAPQTSGRPVIVYRPNGEGFYALHYKGSWGKLESYKNSTTGETHTRMDGTSIPDAVMWSENK